MTDSVHLKQPDSVLSPPPQRPPNHLSLKFISLISRSDKPLYVQSFNNNNNINTNGASSDYEDSNNFLKYNFLSHMALDIFASPASLNLREQQYNHYIHNNHHSQSQSQSQSQASPTPSNGGIILLFIQDSIQVYGYETNNGLKIIIGISSIAITNGYHKINFDDINVLFKNIYKCYLRLICNPFNYSLQTNHSNSNDETNTGGGGDQNIENVNFDKNIKKIVNNWI